MHGVGMNRTAHIPASRFPADYFLDQVITALAAADAPALRRLEAAAPMVAAPLNHARYTRNHAALTALLDASARNLRLLRRATGKYDINLYAAAQQ